MIRNLRTSAHLLGNGQIYRYMLAMGVVASLTVVVRASFSQNQQKLSATEYKIKAAYLYNFIRYIEWPSSAFKDAESPFVVGLLGKVHPDLDRSLASIEKKKKVRGRAIKIRRFKSAEEIKDCHVVFLRESLDNKIVKAAIERLDANPVLVVGESSDFLKQGGGINFLMTNNKVRFRLSLKETKGKGLKPSAKLLQIAQVTD